MLKNVEIISDIKGAAKTVVVGVTVKVLDVEYDEELIKVRRTQLEISTPNSKIKVFVIPTNEELAIARDVVRLKNEK